jgi:S1-C subfamily serine protease
VAGLTTLALVAGVFLLAQRNPEPAVDQAALVQTMVSLALEEARAAPPDASVAYQTILPSLVVIQVERPPSAEAGDPGDAAGGDPRSAGLGTGVVVNDQGAILTSLHVVEGVTVIRAQFVDGTEAVATIAAREPASDIAVLQTDRLPEVLVPAVLGGGVQIGEPVFAVGHPLGLVGSLSAGVVSGLNRSVPISEDRTLEGLIQFDASVNPGNSGGPLLDRAGRVVGIVTALANPADQDVFAGIGFAVPIGTAGGAAGGPAQ